MENETGLPSGIKLLVTPAPFEDAHNLLKALLKSAKGVSFSSNILDAEMSMAGLRNNPATLTALIDKVLSAATSDEVERMVFKCFERATYDGVKLTRGMFDEPKYAQSLKEDYFKICYKVIEVNCSPFFKTIFSEFAASAQTPPENPK